MVSYIQDCSPIPGDGTARCWPGSLRRNVTEVFGPLQNLLSMPGVGDYTDNFISRQTVHHPRQWAIGAVWSVAGTLQAATDGRTGSRFFCTFLWGWLCEAQEQTTD